jgi:hypothetical protein
MLWNVTACQFPFTGGSCICACAAGFGVSAVAAVLCACAMLTVTATNIQAAISAVNVKRTLSIPQSSHARVIRDVLPLL